MKKKDFGILLEALLVSGAGQRLYIVSKPVWL